MRTSQFFFLFKAEGGMRDIGVTGVQTCALPIWAVSLSAGQLVSRGRKLASWDAEVLTGRRPEGDTIGGDDKGGRREGGLGRPRPGGQDHREIGRASCRERAKISVVAVSVKKTM